MITTKEQDGNTIVVYRIRDPFRLWDRTRIGAIFEDQGTYKAFFAGGTQVLCTSEAEATREICKRAQSSRLGA